MIAPTEDHPQGRPETTMHPDYLGYLLHTAIDFGTDIGVEPWQVNAMVQVLTSPVDSLE